MTKDELISKKPDLNLNRTRRLQLKKVGKIVLMVLIITIPLYGVSRLMVSGNNEPSDGNKDSESVNVLGAKASQEINREFLYPLLDARGDEVSQLKFVVESVEKRDEILVKGQRANTVEGRTFLIMNMKITNDYDKGVEIDTRDYVRLSINGNQAEWLAPDIHNDPVEVQAISTKLTRLGFPVNDDDTDLLIQMGEVGGDKEQIPLSI